jgi:hypothetical protein
MSDAPGSDASASSNSKPSAVARASGAAARASSPRRRVRSAAGMALQVVLIALGVFLGLAGEEWREDRENRRLATDTLRRFRTEIATNRDIVLGVKDYHAERHAELNAYFAAPVEEKGNHPVRLAGIRPPRFESTAWDLAVATGTLAYLDSELAFALSRTYGIQAMTNELGDGMIDAMYVRSPTLDGEAFLAALKLYYDDLTEIEPGLVPAYDTLIAAIDEALAQ